VLAGNAERLKAAKAQALGVGPQRKVSKDIMQLDIVNSQNEKVGALNLRDEVFGGTPNTALIWESVVRANAADRRGTHATKNRALVSGSGKKPWRQKGTGRARVGKSETRCGAREARSSGLSPGATSTRSPRRSNAGPCGQRWPRRSRTAG
jgi:large subunit ribosomal protein L4